MNQLIVKKFLSSLAIVSLALVLGACQSTASSANGSQGASQNAASQKAGQSAGQNAPLPEPEVVEPPKKVEVEVAVVEDIPVLDEFGLVTGWMRDGVFIKNPDYLKPIVVETPDLLSQTILFFDYDQSGVKDQYRDVLAAHAAYLAANPGLSLRLEGHADERGSREYNIGLGERRAQAVKRALLLNGVSASNLKTISFGEEKPRVQGAGETSWAENRRVELVYR